MACNPFNQPLTKLDDPPSTIRYDSDNEHVSIVTSERRMVLESADTRRGDCMILAYIFRSHDLSQSKDTFMAISG